MAYPTGRARHRHPTLPFTAVTGDAVPAPPLPSWREWDDRTREWWRCLWDRPQSSLWDADGQSLWSAAIAFDELVKGERAPAPLAAELRAVLDRHGASGPRSLMQLRWTLEREDAEPPPAGREMDAARRRRVRRGLDQSGSSA